MNTKISTLLFAIALICLSSCGGTSEKSNQQNSSQGIKEDTSMNKDMDMDHKDMDMDHKEMEGSASSTDMNDQGVGTFKDITFPKEIDKEMAAKGKKTFETKCTVCHQLDTRLVGPPLKGIYATRNPAWVMNMIHNPDKMLKENPAAKALQEEYGGAIMLNLGLKDNEVREIAEFLRTAK